MLRGGNDLPATGEGECNRCAGDLVLKGVTPSEEVDFTAFVRERGDALLRYARLLVPDSAEAEDVLQVALLRLLRHWPKQLQSPEGYVRGILVNLIKDRARRRHLVPVPARPPEQERDFEPDLADAIAARSRLDEVLAVLPPRQRIAVVLRTLEGLSEAETAEAMGCSTGTVKSNLARGLAKARAVLDNNRITTEGSRR